MDRDVRREIRKRGAASRPLATSQDDVVIKTPKWVPVSRDSGALITEQMSLEHSPLYQKQYQDHQESTPTRQRTSFSQHVRPVREFIDPSLVHREQPHTPQERIGYTYEPTTNESNRSVVSSRPTPQKNKWNHSRSTSRDETGPSLQLEQQMAQQRSQSKSHKKRKPMNKTKPKAKKSKKPQKEPEDEYDDTTAYVSAPDDEVVSLDEFVLEEDSDEDAMGKHQPSIEISRLPTTSNRLTGIDVVMHYLKVQMPNSQIFDTFDELNQEMFAEILDLNLVNNHYVYQLRDHKSDKQNLRKDILQKRKEVAEQMAKLEKLRHDYNKVRTLLAAKWKIANKLQKAKELAQQQGSSSSSAQVVEKLNKLNNVLDPHWSLVDKLRALNERLYALDRQIKQ